MKIVVVGTGYVGLVTGTCFAEMGNNVTCVDVNPSKIRKLNDGIIPIYEPGLEDMVHRNVNAERLHFTTDLSSCIEDAEVVFSAVGTPPKEDGSADLKYVLEVAKEFGTLIKKYTVFVTKSTVPVGTAKKVKDMINSVLQARNEAIPFDVVSNPEFLKEGTAVKDFMYPERIVVGCENGIAKHVMESLYRSFVINDTSKIIFTDIPSAEMIKYASNSMLATRISFMNEIANLCDKVGANVENVRRGMGTDSRIGAKFLYAGCGYGGSCFPKDVKALIQTGKENGCEMKVLEAVEETNKAQKLILVEKMKQELGNLRGSTIGIWGLAFKPETDDIREAPSIEIIKALLAEGAKVKAYDPIAMANVMQEIENVTYCVDKYDAIKGADALVLVTEWKEFRIPDWNKIKSLMVQWNVFDGRNIYDKENLNLNGFRYFGIGK